MRLFRQYRRRVSTALGPSATATAEAPNPEPAKGSKSTAQRLAERRRDVREWLKDPKKMPPGGAPLGLALSGGGIRSATFSLGLLQALAKHKTKPLAGIDLLSTVSGGGYIGCFLRSLFLPSAARGIEPDFGETRVPNAPWAVQDDAWRSSKALEEQYQFAMRALTSPPEAKSAGPLVRNPLWWLREHSRYLAPNGPTDYGYAAAYLARNWVAMVYIFVIAVCAVFTAVIGVEALLRWIGLDWPWLRLADAEARQLACGRCLPPSGRVLPISPLLMLAPLAASVSGTLAIAYWLTEGMSGNEPVARKQRRALVTIVVITLAGAIAILLLVGLFAGDFSLSAAFAKDSRIGRILPWVLSIGTALTAVAALVALVIAGSLWSEESLLTAELRRHLTLRLATFNLLVMVILGISLVDSLGAGLAFLLRQGVWGTVQAGTAALVPAFAFLIHKLPTWLGGSGKSGFGVWLFRLASPLALIAGALLYGSLAVAGAAIVHHFAWAGAAWASDVTWYRFGLFAAVVAILAILSGTSTGFINLSSLHLFYSSRLTRAYLGASNSERLNDGGSNIRDNHLKDYIQPALYSMADLPGPIHLINATVNETIDPRSQLVARDRKGEMLTLYPHGIQVGPQEAVAWSEIGKTACAESLSLGQWCAISGAAASSGMGRLTNLGFALAMTFANVRLGYWWASPGIEPRKEGSEGASDKAARPRSRAPGIASQLFGTFIYLWNEMTARYSLGYRRKYLTDGGHFENSGAYPLIRAGVPLILVSDNGADPDYAFSDLETLVRTVRLDLGWDLDLLGGAELEAVLDRLGAENRWLFVDAGDPKWREAFRAPDKPASVLVLRGVKDKADIHLFWLKPRLFPGLPPDVAGYASAHPDFPHQTTGDQFFEEAQWESYRKLGEESMTRLLDSLPHLMADPAPPPAG